LDLNTETATPSALIAPSGMLTADAKVASEV